MKRHVLLSVAIAAATPLAVDIEPAQRDSSVTSISIGAGTASYALVTRGCDNSVISKDKRFFKDMGASVEHKFSSPVRLGVRAVALDDLHPDAQPLERRVLWNPHVSLDWKEFSIGGGYVFRPDVFGEVTEDFNVPSFSAHIRFGDPDKTAFAVRVFEDVPAFSGSGVGTIGVELRPARSWELMVGAGTPDPYDHFGFVTKSRIGITRSLRLDLGGRLGGSQGIAEMGLNAGLTFAWIHRHEARSDRADSAASGALGDP